MCELLQETIFNMGKNDARAWLENSLMTIEEIEEVLDEVFS